MRASERVHRRNSSIRSVAAAYGSRGVGRLCVASAGSRDRLRTGSARADYHSTRATCRRTTTTASDAAARITHAA